MTPGPAASTSIRVGVGARAWDIVSAQAPASAQLLRLEDDTDIASLRELEVMIVNAAPSPILQALPELDRLRLLQTLSAGTDTVAPYVPAQATLCSAQGARDSAVAEWILGALLGASTHLLARTRVREWQRTIQLSDLSEWRVLVLGMGSIGRELQRILVPFGTDVAGVASRARDDLHGIDELEQLLPTADAVVLLTPLTDATRGLIDADAMALMRDGTLIVNAARGGVLDTDALVAETRSGRLQAVLDVTDPEPLPDGHPLWTARGVLAITPHIAGDSPRAARRAAQFAADQLIRFAAGEPLLNVVRPGRTDRS